MKKIIIIVLLLILIILGLVIYTLIPKTFKIDINKIAIKNATITGFSYKYNNPVIPKGFKAVEDGASWKKNNGKIEGWDKGLVIEDKNGNQFVWVPVKDGVQANGIYEKNEDVAYKRWHIYKEGGMENVGGFVFSIEDTSEDELPEGVTNEEEQIMKYGGFYIGRYETGIEENDFMKLYDLKEGYEEYNVDTKNNQSDSTPVIKSNSQLWNFIEYENAKKVSEKMYKTDSVISGLMTGRQFDTILRWAETSGYDLENPITWGNFYDTTELEYTGRHASYLRRYSVDWKTKDYGIKKEDKIVITSPGGVKQAKMNEIYDIVGNVFEFTTDILTDGRYSLIRGGTAAYGGKKLESPYPATCYSVGAQLHYVIGFRVVLYIL